MMKPQLFLTLITAGLIAGLSSGCSPVPNNQVSFACDEHLNSINNEFTYTTVASDSQNSRAIIHWKTEDFSGNGYTPQVRCQKVSPQFQLAYDNGSLKYLTHGIRAIEINPQDGKVYLGRGLSYSILADRQKAVQDIEKAVLLFHQQGDTVSYQTAQKLLKALSQ